MLAHPELSNKQVGYDIGRSTKAVTNRLARLKSDPPPLWRKKRTAESIIKFKATMAAKEKVVLIPPVANWDAALKGRTFGPGAASGGPVRVLRIGYAGGSLMGCAAAMCAE